MFLNKVKCLLPSTKPAKTPKKCLMMICPRKEVTLEVRRSTIKSRNTEKYHGKIYVFTKDFEFRMSRVGLIGVASCNQSLFKG
eukprot:5841527-Pleurochrysis_carterae.AAC.4